MPDLDDIRIDEMIEEEEYEEIEELQNDPKNNYVDYAELIKEEVFDGEYPFDEIIAGITDQFMNYIITEDDTDYVEVFYDTMRRSYEQVRDEEEEHPEEIKEALQELYDEFMSTVVDLFDKRFNIHIPSFDTSKYDYIPEDERDEDDDTMLDTWIWQLYNFFILQARDNFKTFISRHISTTEIYQEINDENYAQKLEQAITVYDPLITASTPAEFLRLLKADDITELYNKGYVSGNFLKKYSAKLYRNEDFKIEIFTNILLIKQVLKEAQNGE